MDSRTRQAIKDMRRDLAILEVQLDRIKNGDCYNPIGGQPFSKRAVLEDQILELRMRLKEMLKQEDEDEENEMPCSKQKTTGQGET